MSYHGYPTQTLVNYSEKAVNVLCELVTRHIEATSRMQSSNGGGENSESWWKLRESSILAMSKIKDDVVKKHTAGVLQFDIIRFLDTVVLATLNDSGMWKRKSGFSYGYV